MLYVPHFIVDITWNKLCNQLSFFWKAAAFYLHLIFTEFFPWALIWFGAQRRYLKILGAPHSSWSCGCCSIKFNMASIKSLDQKKNYHFVSRAAVFLRPIPSKATPTVSASEAVHGSIMYFNKYIWLCVIFKAALKYNLACLSYRRRMFHSRFTIGPQSNTPTVPWQ